ncbi:transcription elongation factor GreB [Roseococcus sp. SYP-B2431]|uniref:transcription elongation factor GreB n=1 Tax=Roseococcus sp. SYP-B2431 TaxID=2496640 RepID=UPI001039D996|nr:transcription elongation factor GreB [Roseococcus sp. SYP-B2431]TCH97073.1 transcription elongation factor GreB [Roseococcus sp. SYP-B2431]
MSQDDDDDDEGPPGVPPGTPFYMTPDGHAALQAELHQLWHGERPKVTEIVSWAAALGDRSENADYQYGKRRLRQIDSRVRFLRRRLDRAEVVDPRDQKRRDQVFFGATVTYAREDDSETTVTIVGMEEADATLSRISWVSPVARALLGKRVGDLVKLRTPAGLEEIEVMKIFYPERDA